MNLHRHLIVTIRAGAARGNAGEAGLVSPCKGALETAKHRLRMVGTLAGSWDAAGVNSSPLADCST